MCRNIRNLFNFDPPVTEEEVRAASLQFARKICGFTKPSKTNEDAFSAAVDDVTAVSARLLRALATNAPPKNREEEAAKARARSAARFAAFAVALLMAWNVPQAVAQAPMPGARVVTVSAIPGVVAAGSQWSIAWQGPDNADGIVGTADGGLLFAQEQPNKISKLDSKDHVTSFLEDTHGTGAVSLDPKGRVFVVERTCTDPGRKGPTCTEPTAVAMLAPQRKTIADNIDGKSLGRVNDLIVSKTGHIYFTSEGLFHVDLAGKVSTVGANLRTNGIMLSRDEKILYVTNREEVVAFDVQPDGGATNQRVFAKLEAGGIGDGMAIDAQGRLYVTSAPGVQVFSAEGKYLGVIPTPRPVISVAFTGKGKKTMYVVGAGALGADGKEFQTPQGVRNNAKTIYKIATLAQGFKGRAK
jgi:gluconolactonase